MKKLLHERLREFARILDDDGNFTFLELNEAESLADEIEKYYIPRPRFKDGEPVQFGDEVEGCNGKVGAVLIFPDGSGYVYGRVDSPFSEPLGGAIIENGLKRPSDSLEKVQDTIDALANVYESDDRLCDDLHNISDRITALIERGA